jgi:2-polyprenyl-3-methyl-5-hydroxy-6-metoxy-1,4-benzoquinol methylase
MDKTQMAVNVFNKCAAAYQDKFMDVSLYKDSFDLFCKNIVRNDADILEIACGPGNITRYLLNKRPGFKILGIDLAPSMLELARSNNPESEFRLMDCRDIGTLGKMYDAVMCGFCLPYLSRAEAVKLINDASGLLTTGGVVYLSTMEDDYSRSGYQTSGTGDQLYMYFHEAGYLYNALKKNGFTTIDLQHKEHVAADGTKTTDMIFVAKR